MSKEPIEQSAISNIEEKYDIQAILKKLTVEDVKEFNEISKPYNLGVNILFFLIGVSYLFVSLKSDSATSIIYLKMFVFLAVWMLLGTFIKIKLIVGSKKFRQFVVDNDGFGHKK